MVSKPQIPSRGGWQLENGKATADPQPLKGEPPQLRGDTMMRIDFCYAIQHRCHVPHQAVVHLAVISATHPLWDVDQKTVVSQNIAGSITGISRHTFAKAQVPTALIASHVTFLQKNLGSQQHF